MFGVAFQAILWGRLGLIAALVFTTAGCLDRGFNALEAELSRVKADKGFAVISHSAQQADISAMGRKVRIEPARGLCIAEESLTVAEDGAFAMIADCTPDGSTATDGSGRKHLALPPSFPGILTVSVSGQRGFGDNPVTRAELDKLREFLTTNKGRALLGRAGKANGVEILESRVLGDALYVYVADKGEQGLSVFSPRFWRAFARINDRLVLATVNGFAARPAGDDRMLAVLALQVTRLRQANLAPVHEDEVRVARLADKDLKVAAGAVLPSLEDAIDAAKTAPLKAPRPAVRLQPGQSEVQIATAAEVVDETSEILAISEQTAPELPPTGSAGRWAPNTAPAAPQRPG